MDKNNLVKSIKVDRSALKFNQGSIVFFVAVAFLFNVSWLIAFVSLVLIVGTVFPKVGLFKLTYIYAAKPLGLIKPDVIEEDNSPHLFAQGLGGVFLAVSFIALSIFNLQTLGWLLSLIVLILALINIVFNFCAGCFIYFQLGKIGVIGNNKLTGNKNA